MAGAATRTHSGANFRGHGMRAMAWMVVCWWALGCAAAGRAAEPAAARAANIAAAALAPGPAVALITGSDRGIGFALTQELAGRGWKVIATCRDPEHAEALQAFAATHPLVQLAALDVADNGAIERLADKYRAQPIDALVNNAGITGDLAAQRLANLEPDNFAQVMRVNAYAPLRMARAFLEQVAMSRQKKIIAISSGAGSLWSAPQMLDSYYYNMSKSALNMGMRLLQNDVRARGIRIGIVTPGPVETDMQKQYRAAAAQAGKPVTYTAMAPADSARALADYIEGLGPEKAGRFYSYTGQEVPW